MRRGFIVLMLSLDISGAYNNIPYPLARQFSSNSYR
jgi:hypothetical protein